MGYLLCGFLLSLYCTFAAGNEADITFASLRDNVLTVSENTRRTIHFTINNPGPSGLTRVDKVHVTYRTDGTDRDLTFCTIRDLTSGKRKNGRCSCVRQSNTLQCEVINRFLSEHNGQWTFTGKKKQTVVFQATLTVNVTYPVTLENFTPGSVIPVSRGASAHLLCSWTEGNPKTPVLIVGPDHTELARQNSARLISSLQHTIHSAGCADMGDYRCAVDGTDQSLELTLLVACPLQFDDESEQTVSVTEGDDAEVQFDVTSYSTELAVCELSRSPHPWLGPGGNNSFSCDTNSSMVTMTGTPPHLRMTLLLANVTSQDEGQWTLTAGNGEETDPLPTVTFRLTVVTDDCCGDGFPVFWIAVGGGIALALVIIIIILNIIVGVSQTTDGDDDTGSTQ